MRIFSIVPVLRQIQLQSIDDVLLVVSEKVVRVYVTLRNHEIRDRELTAQSRPSSRTATAAHLTDRSRHLAMTRVADLDV